jgi:hypothetical protein
MSMLSESWERVSQTFPEDIPPEVQDHYKALFYSGAAAMSAVYKKVAVMHPTDAALAMNSVNFEAHAVLAELTARRK